MSHALASPLDGVGSAGSDLTDEVIELRFLTEENSALAREILLRELTPLAPTGWKAAFDLSLDRQELAIRTPKKNETHHGQEVLVAREVRIRA
jgi:hypothetical protein